ncbi:MBL fold metallo-hydrolase [Fredinandcohnia sp. QZ13]|uniref:MBL fold metallo-hydrolase n=1 Tax=Fredinandcohnia sp. QZ13 TaxID=3073144 RepID=UPI0028536585|nr:MBL fold metallo-hydrolase [Fredinandcohnia sp. QZ13]MDR4886675.1 MBL fold metallo-hydrolase [Fredinandcohnia sp. QZ13]
MTNLTQLNERIFLIDAHDLGRKARTGSYIIKEEKITIVETSASPSISYILEGLKELNIHPNEVEYIIVTHIHLDHAGGAGLLLQHCPNAKVVVHPKGARHLADPSRLMAGAKAVYGEDFDRLFHPIIPISEENLIVKEDRAELTIGPDCTLVFYDSPGHSNHHFSIFDPVSNGVFTGDTIGVYYHELVKDDIELFLPSTSPNQFRPDAMLESVEKIKSLQVTTIYFGHFGMTTNVNEVYKQISFWLPIFVNAGKESFAEHPLASPSEHKNMIKELILKKVTSYLDERNVPRNHDVYEIIELDLDICSMGIVDYLLK